MANSRICSVPDCGKPFYGRDLCQRHWLRWRRHGDPLGGGTTYGEPLRYYREVVLPYDGDECLIWPFAKSKAGYGQLRLDGKAQYIHRRVCEDAHGPAPTPEHEAAHSCGNGHKRCCAKRHLSWKTHAGNMADMVEHGTSPRGVRQGNARLTETQVHEIRALRGKALQREIASRFSISAAYVSEIQTGKKWQASFPPHTPP